MDRKRINGGINLQEVIKCPNCGGSKIKSAKEGPKTLMWLGLLSCITIIGLPVGIILLGIALVAMFMKTYLNFKCRECKHLFKVSESTYREYDKAVSPH